MQLLFDLESLFLRWRISEGEVLGASSVSLGSATDAFLAFEGSLLWDAPRSIEVLDMRDRRGSGPLQKLSAAVAALRRLLTAVLLLIVECGRSLLRL